jgi:hypothetical protein
MLVICFEKNRLLGGYGDRIVGLIAVQIIAAELGQEFRILWEKEDITPYFEYAAFNNPNEDTIENNLIDNQLRIKEHLMTAPNPFPDPITKFFLNQEIAQYRFKDADTYFNAIFAAYKALYTETLRPTARLLDKVDECLAGHQNIVGIQIRCGDCFMATNKGEWYNTGARDHIHAYLTQIKSDLDVCYSDYSVFVTSDFPGILEEARQVFDTVLYIDDPIQHIDRPAINEDISKVFADNYILSQRTAELYISANSNYGRVAALSATHDRIYDVTSAQPLDKRRLLSKGECMFA